MVTIIPELNERVERRQACMCAAVGKLSAAFYMAGRLHAATCTWRHSHTVDEITWLCVARRAGTLNGVVC